MPLIIKNIDGQRRAAFISNEDADNLVAAGRAAAAPGYPDIYEEASDGEFDQGYLTRSMVALPAGKRRGRPPKVREDIPVLDIPQVSDEAE